MCGLRRVTHNPVYNINVTYGHPDSTRTQLAREFVASSCVVVSTETLLSCQMGAGTGKDHYWRAKIAGQATALRNSSTYYSPPFVTQLDGPAAEAAQTTGGEVCLAGPLRVVTVRGVIRVCTGFEQNSMVCFGAMLCCFSGSWSTVPTLAMTLPSSPGCRMGQLVGEAR